MCLLGYLLGGGGREAITMNESFFVVVSEAHKEQKMIIKVRGRLRYRSAIFISRYRPIMDISVYAV